MRAENDFKDFLALLNKKCVNYCIAGGFGVIFHGRPRFTGDLDILIEPSIENSEKIYRAIKEFGADVSNIEPDYFSSSGNYYQIGVTPVQIHILTSITGIEVSEVMVNKIKAEYGDIPAYFIALDDLLANKKALGRDTDKLDVKALELSKDRKKLEGKE